MRFLNRSAYKLIKCQQISTKTAIARRPYAIWTFDRNFFENFYKKKVNYDRENTTAKGVINER